MGPSSRETRPSCASGHGCARLAKSLPLHRLTCRGEEMCTLIQREVVHEQTNREDLKMSPFYVVNIMRKKGNQQIQDLSQAIE